LLTPTTKLPPLRVTIYRTSSIGDAVLSTACLNLLMRVTKDSEITFVGRNPTAGLIKSSYPQVRVLTLQKNDTLNEIMQVIEQLKDQHLMIDLQANIRSRFVATQLRRNKTQVVTMPKGQVYRGKLLLDARLRGRRHPLPEGKPRRLQYQAMLETLLRGLDLVWPIEFRDGLRHIDARPTLPLPETGDQPWLKELKFGTWIGIAPGAAFATKQAPIPLLSQILEKVQVAHSSDTPGLILLGDTKDRACANELLGDLHWRGPILNLCGRLSLYENALALRQARALLANDSALAHIAEAVGTPVSTLFGPTVEGFGFGPHLLTSRPFSSNIGCRPCSKHGRASCRYNDRLCFTTINAAHVAGHLLSNISAGAATASVSASGTVDQLV
jgi:ADP-heptose:LPS heptosyltransferase